MKNTLSVLNFSTNAKEEYAFFVFSLIFFFLDVRKFLFYF